MKKQQRTDDDYCRLDDAIATIADWAPEIIKELNKRGYSEQYLSQVEAAIKGRRMTLSQWAVRLGVKRSTLNQRLRRGWSVSKAFTTEVHRVSR